MLTTQPPLPRAETFSQEIVGNSASYIVSCFLIRLARLVAVRIARLKAVDNCQYCQCGRQTDRVPVFQSRNGLVHKASPHIWPRLCGFWGALLFLIWVAKVRAGLLG